LPKPKLTEQPKSTSAQPLVHPFTDALYKPPHKQNFAAAPAKPVMEKELTYQTVAPIQNPKIVTEIYNKFLKLPLVTLSPEELFTISPVIS
jgi:hypothetical protein